MTRPRLRAWLLGIVAFLVFLIAGLPATYVTPWVSRHVPGLQLDGISGSVLDGSAESARFGATDVGALEWRFDWLALFTASVGYRVHVHDADRDLSARLDTGIGGVHVRDLKGRVSVASLDRWLPLPSHSLSGSLVLDLAQLRLKDGKLQSATGQVELDDAVLTWPSPSTLGSFRMDLEPLSGGGVSADIHDTASPLRLGAKLTLGADGRYHLVGVLAPKDSADTTTRKLLANLGNPDSTGQYPFDFNGQW